MISVSEASQYIKQHSSVRSCVIKRLEDALNYTIAELVYSPINWPTHPQSAMDGYGILHAHFKPNAPFQVQQILAAGHAVAHVKLNPNEAVRIFTGAFVPEGIDTIIQQEHIRLENEQLVFPAEEPKIGLHIRPAASQTRMGDIVAKPGDVLTPARCAFLVGLGITEVAVFEKPKVSIVCTGSELLESGQPLVQGMIYESNSMALKQTLLDYGIHVHSITICPDDRDAINITLKNALLNSDMVLVTGGVSVGDYDIVVPVLNDLGVDTIFHKVKQKPGKPFYFGKKGNCAVFGLPGNPASVLTCFYMYTLPFIGYGEQRSVPGLLHLLLPLKETYTKKTGLTHIVRAVVEGGMVSVLPHQESYKMDAFAEANALILINESVEVLEKGIPVDVYLL